MPFIGNPVVSQFQARPATQEFNGNGSTTTFTLNQTVTQEDIIVSVDGVVQESVDAFTVPDGTTLTFTAAPSSGTGNIFVIYMGVAASSVSPPASFSMTTLKVDEINSATTNGNLTLDPNGTGDVVVSSGHKVGIGVTSPTQALHVDEPTSNNQAIIINSSLSTFQGQVLKVTCDRDTSNNSYNLCLMGADRFVVRDSGNVKNVNNSYGALSDSRSKENIKDAGSQWNDIKALQIRNYNLIGSVLTQIGVVSQEVEAAGMSGLVEEAKLSEPDADGNDVVRKNVKYSVLYMKAVKALQEAMTRIETLETKVAALEAGE